MAATSSSSTAVPDDMHIYQNRLASFSKVQPRRRASSATGKSSQPPLMWPHTSPSIEKLAKAGFYYRPTVTAPDNACCYLCKKNLDGWEPDDIPAIEHAKHSLSCGWAIIHATEVRIRSNFKAVIEDPKSEGMVEARRMTFGKWWPHEKKKGWWPKVDKLAEAGFHYAPTVDSDDFVQCAYCELGLDGWDPEDDPLEEHKRRQSDCKFFAWKKPRSVGGRASSVDPSTTTRERARSVSADPEALQDESLESDLSIAESTISTTTRGRKKATYTTRGRKPPVTGASRRKPRGGKDYDSELDSIPGSPPPVAEPRGRVPRGKKRTSSALGANGVSLFDANDFVEEQFAKPAPAAAAKPGRQSKRSRVSTASNAVVDEDRGMQYESDASVATNATGAGGASKRKRGAAGRGAKAISRYQIPDDEEIDRALALDLERELSDDGDTTRYIKPFIKTPKRRLTRSKMIKEIQMEGPPPTIGGAIGAALSKSAAKKFTPAGMRNYFANQDLDYSLPISIPRHLAVRDENGEFENMDEDTPIKEKPGRGKKAAEKVVEQEPELMQEDDEEIVIVSERITKEGGRRKMKKPTAKELAAEKAAKAAAERTTAAAVVAAAQAAAALAPPPAKRTMGKRLIEKAPAPEAKEASPARLRNIRKSIDGGMVLFDGGATSSEDESDALAPQPQPQEPTPEPMEEEPEPDSEPKPSAKGRNGGKKAASTAPPAKGKRGKKAARAPTPEPVPDEVMEEAPPTPPPAPAKGKKGRKAPVSKKAAAADTNMASAASALRSPSPAPAPALAQEAVKEWTSRSHTRDSGARLSAAENVVHPKLGTSRSVGVENMPPPPPPEPKGKRAAATSAKEQETKRESVASNQSVRSGNMPPYVGQKPTANYDDALARSFAKKQVEVEAPEPRPEEEVVVGHVEEVEDIDPVMQQLAMETEVAEQRRRSFEMQKKKKQMKEKRGKERPQRRRKVEDESEEEGEYEEEVKPAGSGRGKKQEKEKEEEEKQQEELDAGPVVVTRRQSNRFRSSIVSPPKYTEPSSSSEEEAEEEDEVGVVEGEGEGEGEEEEEREEEDGNEETEEDEAEAEYQDGDQNESEEGSESGLEDPGTNSPEKLSRVKTKTSPTSRKGATATATVGGNAEPVVVKPSGKKPPSSPVKSTSSRMKSGRTMRASESFAQTIPGGRGRYVEDTTTATEDDEDEDEEDGDEAEAEGRDMVDENEDDDNDNDDGGDGDDDGDDDNDDGETTPQPADDTDSDLGEEEDEEEDPPRRVLSPPKPRSVANISGKSGKEKEKASPYTTRLPFSPIKAKSATSSHQNKNSNPTPPLPQLRNFSSDSHSQTSPPPPPPARPGLESTHPWTPIDIDSIAPLADMDIDPDGERGDVEGGGDDPGELLTTEEKSMTVQEWVRRNAERAEERFRERCEGVIGRLVEEGRRAVRAIEGIGGG